MSLPLPRPLPTPLPPASSAPPVTVLGECVADAFTVPAPVPGELALRVLPGGGPANTAVALARLGTPARLLARLSDDVFGRLFRAHLEASGVDLTAAVRAPEPSTLAVAELDAQGRAAYSFHAQGTADWQWTARELSAVDLAGAPCLHAGSLALVREPGGAVVEDFLARASAAATISLDPNVRPLLVGLDVYRERLQRWCAFTDVLRLSEDDLELLLPGTTIERACDSWHAAGAPLVVVTRGERGAVASLNGERAAVPAPPADVVDTVGAGDSFTAGLLHHLGARGLLGGRLTGLRLDDVVDACAFAARVAALTCSVVGPNPPWASQLPLPAPAAGQVAGRAAG
ncbi:carbohydrate kinase [Streptomyces sp. NPDC053541]|uniref:carbohydrate kinase n=1 Tax=Streptomyces sp. NPDC053541 TaxID=3365709 RepID=UPI0037D209E1